MFPLTDEGFYCADMDSHYLETWEAMEELVDHSFTQMDLMQQLIGR